MMNRFEGISPEQYAAAASVALDTAKQLRARLEWVKLNPAIVLDLGSRDGQASALLKQLYPSAEIIGIDGLLPFLQFASTNQKEGIHWVGGDVYQLPIKDYAVDFIFANLLLPWCEDLQKILQEWRRILKPNGLLMFSTLGPSTLSSIDAKELPYLIEMHDLGDVLLKEGFRDPVLDVETVQLNFENNQQAINELRNSGFVTRAVSIDTAFSASFEVIYAHAWGPLLSDGYAAQENGEVSIPLRALRMRGRGF